MLKVFECVVYINYGLQNIRTKRDYYAEKDTLWYVRFNFRKIKYDCGNE